MIADTLPVPNYRHVHMTKIMQIEYALIQITRIRTECILRQFELKVDYTNPHLQVV